MKKTQATEGVLGGHALSRRALLQSHGSPQMHAVLEPCSVAAASERPGLAAAVTELAEVVLCLMPMLAKKTKGVAFSKKWRLSREGLVDAGCPQPPLGWQSALGLKVYEHTLCQCFWAIGQVS